MEWFDHLPPWVSNGSYYFIFTILTLCGLGFPIPEEVSFLLGGYLVDKIDGSLGFMIFMAVSGVLLGDTFLFFLARRYGTDILRIWPFRLILSPARLEKAKDFFNKHGSKTVFFAGFLAGIRAPTFFLSSTMGMKFPHFLFWDGMRTLLTCPISVWFGFRFGPLAAEKLEPYKHFLLGFLFVALLMIILKEIFLFRKKETEKPS